MEIINRIKRLYGDNLSKELYKTQKKLNKLKAQNKKLKEKINHHENEIEYLNRIALRHLTNVNYNPIENNCCPYCGSKKFNIEIIPVLEGGNIEEEAYTGDGSHINSDFLNGLNKEQAINKMLEYLEEKNIGKKKVNFNYVN